MPGWTDFDSAKRNDKLTITAGLTPAIPSAAL